MSSRDLVRNPEFSGNADFTALKADVTDLRAQAETQMEHMTLERELAERILAAQRQTIEASDALRLVFTADDKPVSNPPIATSTKLAHAFQRTVRPVQLPDGFARTTGRALRATTHPDKGVDETIAKNTYGALEGVATDPVYSIMEAALHAPIPDSSAVQHLRDERYRLNILLGASTTVFGSQDEAKKFAKAEVEGAEWRMRTHAAFLCFNLITGEGTVWANFLKSIAREQHFHLINMINENLPQILAIQERMLKGIPIDLTLAAKESVDTVLGKIWSTLRKADDASLPYTPPYQNWLPVLLPALIELDPGKIPGEDYSYFPPPFQITEPIYSQKY